MFRLIKPFAPVAISILALLPGPLWGASSPTKVVSRPETPTSVVSAHQINVAEAAAKAYDLQVRRFYKAVHDRNVAVWYEGARAAQFVAYIDAVVAHQHAVEVAHRAAAQPRQQQSPVVSTPIPSTSFGNLSGVVQCIKDHESGNYSESSHPGSGSGAYQFIPGTWRAWSARAGYGGYAYAYQAPPAVQDAVLHYALTNGGAGNWSNRWGNDPCTAGLPGGG